MCGCMYTLMHTQTHKSLNVSTSSVQTKSLSDAGLARREGTNRDGRKMAAGYVSYPTVKKVEHSF